MGERNKKLIGKPGGVILNDFQLKQDVQIRELDTEDGYYLITTKQIEAVSLGDCVIHYYEYIARTVEMGAVIFSSRNKNKKEPHPIIKFQYHIHVY